MAKRKKLKNEENRQGNDKKQRSNQFKKEHGAKQKA
jgi:hypothetical protein